MANRYWVGGTAAWDGTAGSKWALTSGGAGGQAEPTIADDVFFDAASGAVTVTVSTVNPIIKSLNCTGFTGTLTGSANINVENDVLFSAGMSALGTGLAIYLQGTGTSNLTSNGKSIMYFNVLKTGAGVANLMDALTIGNSFTITSGTFTTNNYSVTAPSLSSSNSNTRTINLGSSTATLSAGTAVTFATNTNLTFNAGTSTINCSSAAVSILGGASLSTGVTFYNVTFSSTGGVSHGIQANNTFNNLIVTGPSSVGVTICGVDGRQTINGTLSTSGTAGNRRVWFRSIYYGIAQTLTINSAPSLTDADFRDLYVIGTSAPISGTRIGNLRGCSGITFSTPKTVYWNQVAGGSWTDNAWAASSGSTVNTDNFPLPQDTAIIENTGLNTSASISTPSSGTPLGVCTLNASTRTLAMTLTLNVSTYYGDFTLGSGVTLGGSSVSTFSGRNTQTITSNGKTFSGDITVDSYGGTVQLADALNIGGNNLTITNGTFDTKSYALTLFNLQSANSNVRQIILGASTVTLTGSISFTTQTNFTFNAGTSQINCSVFTSGNLILTGIGVTFYNVSFTNAIVGGAPIIVGTNTFNNLTFTAPSTAGLNTIIFNGSQTINGTLTCAGASAVRRIFVYSNTLGTTRTLTVNTLSATDCDFRDITIAGTAAGSSPTRAGDCGGNTGITFPVAKTVYRVGSSSDFTWNSATAWATSSGGATNVNNFPLAQDIAIIDNNTGGGSASAGVVLYANIGTLNSSARTIGWFYNVSGSIAPEIYKDIITSSSTGLAVGNANITFRGRGTQTITSNGATHNALFIIDNVSGTVQLADAFTNDAARTLTLTSGTFDAVTYNVTTGLVSLGSTILQTLKMGSGTWTLSGTGTVWAVNNTTNFTLYKGTANIVLSNTSTTARTFLGLNQSYNKLTIGGATGTSTTSISGANQFTELASTKTVAHTIDGTQAQTFGAWTVTGTAGNVVTLSGTATFTIAGARVSGVDYLALGTTTMSTTSPAEFYAGVNSTGGTGFILTAAPTPVTRYWRGGTGTWDATTTTNWSATSGGAGGASVPTSADAVIFDSLSNATAYTVTCTATQLRCGALTMAGPASGNVTWAGSAPIAMHNNVSLSATGITRTYTGNIILSGSTTGRTFTTNGVSIASGPTVNGVGCGWALGSALTGSGGLVMTNGSFDTANYNIDASQFSFSINTISLTLGSSNCNINNPNPFAHSSGIPVNSTFNAGTSTITFTGAPVELNVWTYPIQLYNVAFTFGGQLTYILFGGLATFNNLTFPQNNGTGVIILNTLANMTINGTLSINGGNTATQRYMLQSNTLGTTRTLTVNAFLGTDVDFRDITVTGTAAPISGTRLGDCKGNSGITFGAGVTRYWNLAGGGNWSATGWAATSGGTPAVNNFPLAQDTALFEATGLTSGSTITINASYNIGTINMSARTSNTMTLAQGSITSGVYGNFIVGTGISFTGTPVYTFAGRGTQQITSAGKQLRQLIIDSPGGSVVLQDALDIQTGTLGALTITSGTFNANGYNVTLSSATNSSVSSSNTNIRTIAIGSGTWTIAGNNGWGTSTATNLTVTGTGTISCTSASTKTFAGGGANYSGITINQGGAGTLTITGNNTFANITNTYSATGATNITLGTTTQTVGAFTATGAAGRVLTVQGTSAASPATLVYTGASTIKNSDYLAITGVRAYSLANTWYAGNNSTNNGSLGWIFAAAVALATGNFLMFFN